MDDRAVLEQLKPILMDRLKFDPARAAQVTLDTYLPKEIEGSLGLDSLDFIELAMGIEEQFGFAMDEREELDKHFESFDTLVRYITSRMTQG